MAALHYFPAGVGSPTPRGVCGTHGTATPDTDLVTCGRCTRLAVYTKAASLHRDVVDALSYPKEEHPCLPPSTTAPSPEPGRRS